MPVIAGLRLRPGIAAQGQFPVNLVIILTEDRGRAIRFQICTVNPERTAKGFDAQSVTAGEELLEIQGLVSLAFAQFLSS